MSGIKVNTTEDIIIFADIDREFGAFMLRKSGVFSRELQLAGMLLMYELRSGNPQLDLKLYGGKKFENEYGDIETFPDPVRWYSALSDSGLTHVIAGSWPVESTALLVLTGNCTLMLKRYAGFEEVVKQKLLSRRFYQSSFDTDFTLSGDPAADLAVFTALNSRLLVLTGGPGTGKTTLCGRIIREILLRDPEKKIILTAPTGKAQQRLISQIRESADLLPQDSAARQTMMSVSGATLHRFICNRVWRTQLELCDVLVMDECSMVSLEMFATVLKLLPDSASLILVGDRRQLSAVESSTVFSDICSAGKANLLPENASAEIRNIFMTASAEPGKNDFSGYIIELKKNHRSAQAPTICRLAAMMSEDQMDVDTVMSEIVNSSADDFRFYAGTQGETVAAVKEKCKMLKDLPQLCSSGDYSQITEALVRMEKFRFLCAVNNDVCGTAGINHLILNELGILPAGSRGWKPGTMLMIKENDFRSSLCNGDCGIVTREDAGNGSGEKIFVRFTCCPERRFTLSELPPHECGFAISVHKAQGSGYEDVFFILPGYNSRVLDRKLFYTGITRAAKHVEIWGSVDEMRFALTNNRTHASNLFQRT